MRKTVIMMALATALLFVRQNALIPATQPEERKGRDGRPVTIAHDFLDMEREFGASEADYRALGRIIDRAAAAISVRKGRTNADALSILRAIDSLITGEGYRFGKNQLLSSGLRNKTIDCDNYCALYTAIAETLGLPILPVYAPDHGFVRFFFDDGAYINWETTQALVRTDSYYIETLRIPVESVRAGVYMKTLSRKEFIAVEYNNIGAHLMASGKYASSLPYLSAAVELYPVFSSAYHNRGSSLYALKRLNDALADLKKANRLDRSRAGTHNTMGDIHLDRGELDSALAEFQASIELDPTNYVPYNSIAIIMKLRGEDGKSRIWAEKSRRVRERHEK